MRVFSSLVYTVTLVATATLAFAQSTGTSPVAVDHAWARATPGGATTAAVYMAISNKANIADRLTGGSSPSAEKVQVHETKMVNNVMEMHELSGGLPVPAMGSVTLKPGSYHVMLIGLKEPLKVGEKVALTLTFEKAGNVAVSALVQPMGASEGPSGQMGTMEMK